MIGTPYKGVYQPGELVKVKCQNERYSLRSQRHQSLVCTLNNGKFEWMSKKKKGVKPKCVLISTYYLTVCVFDYIEVCNYKPMSFSYAMSNEALF